MRLSVVIPVFNEPDQVAATIRSVTADLENADRVDEAEIVIADDGSTIEIAAAAASAEDGVRVHVVRLMQNSGRFAARRTGLAAATGDYVLFVDAGVTIVPGSIPFATQAATDGRRVWNAHTELQADGNPYALFWSTVSALAFGDYVDDPRDTSFGPDEFDRYPKGTTCFLAPRELLADAFDTFTSRYSDTRNANDDGPIIRSIAERERINIAPAFACVYSPRTTLKSFVKHALHRGVVFVDGHGRRESRFFPIVVAFFPVSATLAAVTMRRPLVLPLTLAAASGAALATGIARRRPSRELAPFALLTPVYAVAHGLGMWKGVALALSARLQARP